MKNETAKIHQARLIRRSGVTAGRAGRLLGSVTSAAEDGGEVARRPSVDRLRAGSGGGVAGSRGVVAAVALHPVQRGIRGGDELMAVGLLLDHHRDETPARGDFWARLFVLERVG